MVGDEFVKGECIDSFFNPLITKTKEEKDYYDIVLLVD